jgi:hypothetical protein
MTRTLAAGIAIQACLFVAVGLVVLDMRAHHRVERLGGVNVWGYRGDVMGQKRPNEIRVAVVGGDLAYGWGVAAAETLAMYVRRRVSLYVSGSADRQRDVTAVNIAGRGLTPGEYASWIDRFAYLKIDVLCVVPDPPGHPPGDGRFLPDRRSRVFEATGYSPILPLVLREKAAVSRLALLRPVAAILEAADLQSAPSIDSAQPYESAIASAVGAGERAARAGVVVVWPTDAAAAAGRLAPGDSRVQVVKLEEHPETRSADVLLDGYHWSAGGHSRAADAVTPAVTALLQAVERKRP